MQKKISDMFSSSTPTKRKIEETELSAEQLERMENNKRIALEKKKNSSLSKFKEEILSNLKDADWKDILKEEFDKTYFNNLMEFLMEEQKNHATYPPNHQIFEAFNSCSFNNVKIVIIGQDPYHGKNQAHGLAFSVQKGVNPPPSLKNIFKEIKSTVPNFEIPKHGCLINWSKQGVLLLNTSLTVRAATPASHSGKGWEKFTDAAIDKVASLKKHVVFILWGKHAQAKKTLVNSFPNNQHHVLTSAHPSPYSANNGFFGCGHFSKANELLEQLNKEPIDWNLDPKSFSTNQSSQQSVTSSSSGNEGNGSLKIKEIKGDLFNCSEDSSLVHCVSADLRLGKGIAVEFKKRFGGMEELKDQNKQIGEVAILSKGHRFIYNLITKGKYWEKPTYDDLKKSLLELKKHTTSNNVRHLSMPKIGCGLDKLEWPKVKEVLAEVFGDTGMQIDVYTL